MKHPFILVLVLLLTTLRLTASLDTCYQVVEVIEGGVFEIAMTLSVNINESTFSSSESTYPISNYVSFQSGNKQSLINNFDCLYDFDRFEDIGIFAASILEVEELGRVLIVTHHQSEVAYLIIEQGVYLIIPCPESNDCISQRYKQAELADVNFSVTAIPQGSEFTISPAVFDLITEEVIVHEAFNILTVIEHEFELVTEQRAKTFTNICPDYDAIYTEVNEQVLVKESYSVLTVNPAEFELVMEEVLASEAHRNVELVSLNESSQSYPIETSPEYLHFTWLADSICLSHYPYDCVEVIAEEVPSQIFDVSKPSTWDCNSVNDWSDDVLLITNVDATYRTRSYFKLKIPALAESVEVPAVYKTRTYTAIENLSELPDSCIQIAYEIDTFHRVFSPATTTSQSIPPAYKTRQYRKLVKDGEYSFDLPQSFCSLSFTGQLMVNPEEIIYDDYLCELADIQRQEAIKLSLFEAGDLDDLFTPYSSGLFWESLFDFQSGSDDWDIGPLNEAQAQFLDRP